MWILVLLTIVTGDNVESMKVSSHPTVAACFLKGREIEKRQREIKQNSRVICLRSR